jgi:hypothetical protein
MLSKKEAFLPLAAPRQERSVAGSVALEEF